jgi:hypothetical protein
MPAFLPGVHLMTQSDDSAPAGRPAAGAPAVAQAAERVADRLDGLVLPEGPIPAGDEVAEQVLPQDTRLVRWAAPLFLGCAVILLPWIVVTALTLPSRQVSHNYGLAWAGYDVVLLIGLVWTAACSLRRSRRLPIAAAATGALLGADAWFDVLTSPGGWDLAQAIALSLLAELPLAAVCFWLACHSQEVTERRLVLLAGRWRRS